MVLILLQIRQRNLENPSLQSIVGVLNTGGSVDESLSDTISLLENYPRYIRVDGIVLSDVERGWSLRNGLVPGTGVIVIASMRIP